MAVDADDLRTRPAFGRPRRARRARAAAQIDQRPRAVRRARQRPDDFADQQVVERAVKEREGGALAGARERRALPQLVPAFDVGGRQRPQRSGDFGEGEIGLVPRRERLDPGVEVGQSSSLPPRQRRFHSVSRHQRLREIAGEDGDEQDDDEDDFGIHGTGGFGKL